MRSVNVAELKNRLSKYLTFAKAGEEVVIRDRNLPVAKLVPFSAEGADDQELVLVAAGTASPQGATRCKGTLEDSNGERCREQGDRSRSRRPRRRTVKKTTAFWDASALVPLCVHEATSRHAHSHLRRFAPAVWWGSLVEVHSAICRLHRDKEITDLDKQGAVARLRLLNRGCREILPDDQVRDLATQLLDKHSLRAADSLQLAASLIWCEQRPSRRSFICGDQRLAKVAESAGFSVLELSRVVP
jgi:prevent-host-death family protein